MYDIIGGAVTVVFFTGAVIGLITGAVVTYTAMMEKRTTH